MTRSAAPPVSESDSPSALIESHRRELTGYCYRMLGGAAEAEDAVQETMLRAWRSLDRWERRSSLRTWLFRIAHNVCIDMHRSPQRRARPMDLGAPTPIASAALGEPSPDHTFVLPILDDRVLGAATTDEGQDPAALVEARETLRLAFVAALQHLPPRQRSVLILREVLAWSAAEVATLLDTTTASVNSALQRARATMADAPTEQLDPLDDPAHRQLLERYVDAFERYDMDALVALLRDDVVLSMPPFDLWLRGQADLVGWMTGPGHVCEGSRLLPITVNGTAGFGAYHPAGPGVWEPFAIQVIEVADGRITGHHNFLYPDRFADFDLPPRLTA